MGRGPPYEERHTATELTIDDLNLESELTTEPKRPWIARAIAACLPLVAAAVVAFVPELTWELFLGALLACLAYIPIVALWDCWGMTDGNWKAFARTFASIAAMIAGAVVGIVLHLMFHRLIDLDALAIWAFAGATAALSLSIYFPWLGDASFFVIDYFLSGV